MTDAWHTLDAAEIRTRLDTRPEGLTTAEAAERRNRYGPNTLPAGRRLSALRVLLHQFTSPLIYVLIAAGIVSIALQEWADAIFIFLIIGFNAVIGFIQEWKAETSAAALQRMIRIRVRVKRDGESQTLDAEELVPGDVVLLESGLRVPADLRIVEANRLSIEESALTGESLPVEKQTAALPETESALGDRTNMAFAGTTVLTGRGRAVVVATGTSTEIGRIARSVTEGRAGRAPLLERMERFARKISIIVLASSVLLFGIGLLRGMDLAEIFFVAVAVAVSAIPEGLPIAMTVALSIGTVRMARRNVLVRKLAAVESLGSCTYIATDKTGTLTLDQQTVRAVVLPSGSVAEVSGGGYSGEGEVALPDGHGAAGELEALVRAAVLCNEGGLHPSGPTWHHEGDPMDVALLALAYKAGHTPAGLRAGFETAGEIPFESQRRYAAVFVRGTDGQLHCAAKGAAEVIVPQTRGDQAGWLETAADWARRGYRILALAGGPVESVNESELPQLDLLGLVAMIDPLRPEAREAVEACRSAGIEVAMVTGDHPATALAIARDLGIAEHEHEVITGSELGLPEDDHDEAWQTRLPGRHVFARVNPLQKRAIVAGLQARGHFVAVTGDGVNDAPALKTAQIGVAMGSGTDVSKDAAEIVVTDDHFASIAAGVEQGRQVYNNLRKIVWLLVSTGAAEVLMVVLALIGGVPLPFLAVQLLWLNLVTNGIQDVALAFERGEPDLMKQPPRNPQESIFDPAMIRQTVFAGLVMTILCFGLWIHLLYQLGYSEEKARNIVIMLMVLLQNFHVINCRSETRSAFRIPLSHNVVLWLGIAAAQGIHILAMHWSVTQNLLGLAPMSLEEWLKLVPTAAVILVALEIYKWRWRRRDRARDHAQRKAVTA